MAKFYAWGTINATVDDANVVIQPGDEVSPGDVGMEDDQFQQELVDTGVVREFPYPEDLPADQSPADYARQKLQDMANQGMVITPEVAAQVAQGAAPDEDAVKEATEERQQADEEATKAEKAAVAKTAQAKNETNK
jgi:hypothetical protein